MLEQGDLVFKVWDREECFCPRDEAFEVAYTRCRQGFQVFAKEAAISFLKYLNDEGGFTDKEGVDAVVQDPSGDVWDVHVSASLEIKYHAEWDPKKRQTAQGGE